MSYILNVSFYVNPSFEERWHLWFQECFTTGELAPSQNMERPKVFEIISEAPNGFTIYSVQWACISIEMLEQVDTLISKFLHQLPQLFGEDVTYFSSALKQIK